MSQAELLMFVLAAVWCGAGGARVLYRHPVLCSLMAIWMMSGALTLLAGLTYSW